VRTLTRWLPGLMLGGLMAVVPFVPASAATAHALAPHLG